MLHTEARNHRNTERYFQSKKTPCFRVLVFPFAVLAIVQCLAAKPSSASAAPVLRAADVNVTMTSPTSCDVTIGLIVEGAEEIDHRVDAARVELRDVIGARAVGEMRMVGRTQSLVLRPEQGPARRPVAGAYEIRYHAQVAQEREFRCPLWLPTIPTDGQSRAVSLKVDLPAGSQPSDSMPTLTWAGGHGESTLGHLPAFIHVPFAPQGVAHAWTMSQTMDAVTLVVLLGASAIWVWWRKLNHR
jgi:hypothetical protein